MLLACTILLVGIAGALLAGAPASPPAKTDFQSTVGGIGAGVAVDPSLCVRAFDDCVATDCGWRHGPVAGGDRFCPLHGFGPRR